MLSLYDIALSKVDNLLDQGVLKRPLKLPFDLKQALRKRNILRKYTIYKWNGDTPLIFGPSTYNVKFEWLDKIPLNLTQLDLISNNGHELHYVINTDLIISNSHLQLEWTVPCSKIYALRQANQVQLVRLETYFKYHNGKLINILVISFESKHHRRLNALLCYDLSF